MEDPSLKLYWDAMQYFPCGISIIAKPKFSRKIDIAKLDCWIYQCANQICKPNLSKSIWLHMAQPHWIYCIAPQHWLVYLSKLWTKSVRLSISDSVMQLWVADK